MAGIRIFNTNLPYVFRYPEWTQGVFYPSGSIVAVEVIDSDVKYDFYAAKRDVYNLVSPPYSNASDWRIVHQVDQLDSDLLARLNNFDSDIIKIYERMDSDEERLSHLLRLFDSELDFNIDSEIHDRKAADSDLRAALDSEILERKNSVSGFDDRLRELDSDIGTLFARTDSDENALQTLATNFLNNLDSEIRKRLSGDSDLAVVIQQAVHDYLANDSEIDSDFVSLKLRMDSDFAAAVRTWGLTGNEYNWGPQPYASSTDYFLDTGVLTNHNQGWLWLVDHDDQGGLRTARIYIIENGVTVGSAIGDLTTVSANFGIAGDFSRGTQILDGFGGADVAVYTNTGDPLPAVTNANLFTVAERAQTTAQAVPAGDLDTAFRRTVMTVIDMDSDLGTLLQADSDNNLELEKIKHDIAALDSDVLILQQENDSDENKLQALQIALDSETHDRKAADSDLRANGAGDLDSEIHDRKAGDSDLNIRVDLEINARESGDSDLNVRVDSEIHDRKAADSDILAFIKSGLDSEIHDRKAADSEIYLRLDSEEHDRKATDSEIYLRLDSEAHDRKAADSDLLALVGGGLDSEIHDRKAADSDLQVQITDNDSDIAYLYNVTGKFRGSVDVTVDGPTHTAVQYGDMYRVTKPGFAIAAWTGLDSDNPLAADNIILYTDSDQWVVLGAGSDLKDDLDSEIHDRKAGDSDILALIVSGLDSEIHDRKAADSDLQIQIWNNDSDLTYLDRYAIKLRGSVDLTKDGPTHKAVQHGDVYINTGNGAVVSGKGWGSKLEKQGIQEGWSVIYTDSDKWIFFGASGGGADSDTVTSIPSLAWLESTSSAATAYRRHGDFRKLHNTRTTGILFTQDDSDRTWLVYGDAPTKGSTLFDGVVVTSTDLWISTSKAGPKSSGRISFYDETADSDINIAAVLGNATGTIAQAVLGDSEVVIRLNDSEIDAFGIRLKRALVTGHKYRVKYEDLTTREITYLYSPDGTYFRRMMPWEILRRDKDSDVNHLIATFQTGTSNGYPVGSIVAFAHTAIPTGFRVCDGTTYDKFVYPELFSKLGTNRLPDLRNQFLRGYNDGTDGFGSPRAMLSTQADAFRSHTHTYQRAITQFDAGINNYSATNNDGGQTLTNTSSVGGNETRPTNVMVLFAIAMYSGAGLVYDSDLFATIINQKVRSIDSDVERFDSDIRMEIHDRKAADSELSDRISLNLHNSLADDSDLSDRISLELHDRKAADSDLSDRISLELRQRLHADSDLSDRITDNDSDIAYLNDKSMKFRGSVDVTAQGPTHSAIKAGDVYIAKEPGVVGAGWGSLTATFTVEAGNALMYTDSDDWVVLGAGGGNQDDVDSELALRFKFMGKWNPENPPPDSDILRTGMAWRASGPGWINGRWKGLDSEFITENTLLYWNDSEWARVGGDAADIYFKNYIPKTNNTWHLDPTKQAIDYASVSEINNTTATFNVTYQGRTIACTATVSGAGGSTSAIGDGTFAEQANASSSVFRHGHNDNTDETLIITFAEPVRFHMLSFRGRSDFTIWWREAFIRTYVDAARTQQVGGAAAGFSYVANSFEWHRLFGNPNVEIRAIEVVGRTANGSQPGINGVRIHLAEEIRSFPWNAKSSLLMAGTLNDVNLSYENRDGVHTAYNIKQVYTNYTIGGWDTLTKVDFWNGISESRRMVQVLPFVDSSGSATDFVNIRAIHPSNLSGWGSDDFILLQDSQNATEALTNNGIPKAFIVYDTTEFDKSDYAWESVDSELRQAFYNLTLKDSEHDSDIQVLYSRLGDTGNDLDSEIAAEIHNRKAADSDLSDRISLEVRTRQNADSDLRVFVGKVFVQNTAPAASTVHRFDLWIDTDDNTMYRWDSTNGNWIQVVGSV